MDGVPRLLIYSGGQGKAMTKCKSEQLAWSHTFRSVEDSVRRSVFVKVTTSTVTYTYRFAYCYLDLFHSQRRRVSVQHTVYDQVS